MLSKKNRFALSVFGACCAFAVFPRLSAGVATVTVDFNTVQKTLSPVTFSMDASGYGHLHLPDDPAMQAELALLDVAMMRMNLGYKIAGDPNSGIVCLASGATQTITGDQWIAGIVGAGALPQVRVQMNPANSQTTWVNDAKSLVTHFNLTPGNTRVDRWVIYNEPDGNGMSVATYSAGFIAMYNGMKSIDPTIKIGGPATASYNSSPTGYIKTFLQNMKNAGITPDFVDFHSYGTGSNVITDAALLAGTTQKYVTDPADLRAYLVSLWGSTVGNQIPIEIGEWNLSWTSDARQLRHYGSVWAARALSHMVESGVVERFYADKNGNCMGVVCDVVNPTFSDPNHGGTATYTANVDDPMPAYHGIGMFTGEGLFPGFGSNVVTATETSSTGLIHAAASNNPRNIVVINSSPSDTTSTTFNLTGVTNASVAVWQKNSGSQSVVNLGTTSASGGTFAYSLAPYTVTTFVVTPTNPPPPVPTNLAATPGNAQVSLTWTASSGATSYNVKRSTTSGGPYSTVGTPGTNSFTNTSLTNGTTYYYVVSAVNSNGESANSSQVSATPTAGGPLTFEGESLTFGASSGQTWRTSVDSNGSGGAIAFFDSVATGNFITLVTPSVTAGTYEVRVVTKTANTRGIYQLAIAPSLGGTYTNYGTPKDQYSGSQIYGVEQVIGTVTLGTTSTKAIRFTVTGKNASSSSYGLAIDAIKLIPQ